MLLIIAAAPLETTLLRRRIQFTADPEGFYRGETFSGQELNLLHTGVGPTATAISLTRFLEREQPKAVFMIGCGGNYPNSGLTIGDLALATEEIFGDLGAMTEQGFLMLEKMEIPVEPPPVQRIKLASSLQSAAADLLKTADRQLACGPFVTVSTCSGTPQLSRELEKRTSGICENMEGAAAAQACASYEVPFLELRGISNPTGTRDPEQWDLKRGAEAAQNGLIKLLENDIWNS